LEDLQYIVSEMDSRQLLYFDSVDTWLVNRKSGPLQTGMNDAGIANIEYKHLTAQPPPGTEVVSVSGRLALYFIPVQDILFLNKLDSILTEADFLELHFNEMEHLKKIWMERSVKNPDEVILYLRGDLSGFELHIFNPDGEVNYEVHGVSKWKMSFQDLKNSWMELIPRKAFRKEQWIFEINDSGKN
jgi:hypothetical protein